MDPSSSEIETLIEKLSDPAPVERIHARAQLARCGRAATRPLIELLSSSRKHTRWEAAKTLGEIHDPAAAAALIEAMDDRDTDVRWVAAEAIISLGSEALAPLLRALHQKEKAESIQFCQRAHHALSGLMPESPEPHFVALLKALTHEEPAVWVPQAAAEALRQIT